MLLLLFRSTAVAVAAPAVGGGAYAPRTDYKPQTTTYKARMRLGLRLSVRATTAFEPAPTVEYVCAPTVHMRLRISARTEFDDHLVRLLAADEEWLLIGQ